MAQGSVEAAVQTSLDNAQNLPDAFLWAVVVGVLLVAGIVIWIFLQKNNSQTGML